MKKIYTARDPVDASLFKAFLEADGIEASVQDERIFEMQGALPVVGPTVWVSDEDVQKAFMCLKMFADTKNLPARPEWTCGVCGEKVPGTFTECWKCLEAEPPHPPLSRRMINYIVLGFAVVVALLFWLSVRVRKN